VLGASLRRVADYLVSVQDADGYLGTYAPARRFMCRQVAGPRTWDGAPGPAHLGYLGPQLSHPRSACGRTGSRPTRLSRRRAEDRRSLLADIDREGHRYHHARESPRPVRHRPAGSGGRALSGDARAEISGAGQAHPETASEAPALELLPRLLAGTDAAFIATGKAYQLSWNLVGLAKLYKATGETSYLQAVQQAWESIRQHHLTLGGRPVGRRGPPLPVKSSIRRRSSAPMVTSRLAPLSPGSSSTASSSPSRAKRDMRRDREVRLQRPARRAGPGPATTGAITHSRTASGCSRPIGAAASRAARGPSRSCRRSPTPHGGG